MNILELIQNRESIRSYDATRTIEKDTLLNILEAGRLAPSAANKQPWEFILVSGNEMLERVRPCYERTWFQDAPHILIVKGNKKLAWERKTDGYNAIETDLTIAMDHMILMAESMGVASCWIAAFDYRILAKALDLQDHEIVFAITPLGYPKPGFEKRRNKDRKALNEVVRFM